MKSKINKNKTMSLALVTLILLGGIISSLMIYSTKNSERITNQNREYLVDNTTRISDSINSALSDGYSNIKILSELVSKSLTGPGFDIASIQELIQDSVFDFMEFADKDGLDHNITGGVSDATDRQYYLDAKAGNTGMELIYVSRATHETLLMFYSPIYYENEFVGSLVGVYQASNRITHLLSTEYFGETATTYLATQQGRIIASGEGFDPQNEMYVSDLAEEGSEAAKMIQTALQTGETETFTYEDNATGGCIQNLENNGWFVVQIFPKAASNAMIKQANSLSYALVAFLVALWAAVLVFLISFYRNQRDQVEFAREQADAANQAKTVFLFNMSHDIRTPLNAITGYTTMAKRYSKDSKINEYLEKIDVSSKQLLSLVNQVLEMSRIESGKVSLSQDKTDIVEATKAVKTLFAADCNSKNIDLNMHIGSIEHRNVLADYSRINQILTNIIGNAVKYTPEGGSIDYYVDEQQCNKDGYGLYVLCIKDTGIGMSEEYLEHIYEEFTRENTSTVSRIQGTGLGMSIVKKLVEMMDGTIEIKSKQGEGTIVAVSIPMKWDLDSIETIKNVEESDVTLNKKRILLVEDNEMNREIATEILEEEGVIVETAEDGDIAVEMVKNNEYNYYDAVLMDIQMPRMNGYETTKAIRALPPIDKHVPIIALSANAFEEDKKKSLEAGMDDHIAKPINIAQLKETLIKFIK